MKRKLTEKQKETIASLIGEGVHTGLRKACTSPQSSAAWRAIQEAPDWDDAVTFAADEVINYIESGEDSKEPK